MFCSPVDHKHVALVTRAAILGRAADVGDHQDQGRIRGLAVGAVERGEGHDRPAGGCRAAERVVGQNQAVALQQTAGCGEAGEDRGRAAHR